MNHWPPVGVSGAIIKLGAVAGFRHHSKKVQLLRLGIYFLCFSKNTATGYNYHQYIYTYFEFSS